MEAPGSTIYAPPPVSPDRRAVSWARRLRWAPVPVLVALLVVLGGRSTGSFEPRFLLPALNIVFLTGVSLLVAHLAARSYLLGESLSVLLLGCGTLAFGIASAFAAVAVFVGIAPDATVTVHNTGTWVAAACCLGSALLAAWPGTPDHLVRHSRARVVLAYTIIVVSIALVAAAELDGLVPPFLDAQGPTLLRQVVLGSAVAMMVLAAALFRVLGSRSPVAFISWYSLGLLLIAIGLAGVFTQHAVGSTVSWVGRVAQYLGCVYMWIAVVSVAHDARPWHIPLDQILRETRDRYRSLVELSPDAILVHIDTEYVFANSAAARLFGARSPEDLIGTQVLDLVPPDDRETVRKRIEEVRSGHVIALRETQVVRLDGTLADVEVTGTAVEFRGKRAILLVMREITERKRIEQALREANRRKSEFLATLSHELRNPLAPMRYALELLGRDETAPAARRVIERQLAHLVRLVDDLLDVTRIESNKISVRPRPVDIASVARTAIEAASPEIEQGGHRFSASLPDAPLMLEADPDRLAQVITNLLNNAARYTPRGGAIALAIAVEGDEVVISVRDTGIGLSPDDRTRVFDMFTQIGQPGGGGLGIGLAIVKGVVELHGGSVEARSDGLGRGSEFRVRLPRATEPASARADDAPATVAPSCLRILVVDDNVDAAQMLEHLLEFLGHQVRVANDALSALAVLSEFRADVGLFDIGLPGIDGYELAERVRARPGGRPMYLVAVTGWGQESDKQRARQAGFDAHITKPADPDELNRMLASIEPAAGTVI